MLRRQNSKSLFFINFLMVSLLTCQSQELAPQRQEDLITGHAYLQGYENHGGIQVVNVQTADTTVTDMKGFYSLPMPHNDGFFTIMAEYPFFAPAQVQVSIENEALQGLVPDLILHQVFEVRVFTDTPVYTLSDTAVVTVEVQNITDSVARGIGFLFPSDVSFLSLSDSSVWAIPWGPKSIPPPGERDYQPGEVISFVTFVPFALCQNIEHYQQGIFMPAGEYLVYSTPWPWTGRYSTAVRPAKIRIEP